MPHYVSKGFEIFSGSVSGWRKVALIVVAAMVALPSITVVAQETTAQLTNAAVTDADVAQSLANTMSTETNAMALSSTVEDYEATLMFVVSQQEYSISVAEQALGSLEAQSADNPALMTAIARVREALRQRSFRRGTAALSGGNNGGFGSSNFSFPSIGSGGGSSNYGQ